MVNSSQRTCLCFCFPIDNQISQFKVQTLFILFSPNFTNLPNGSQYKLSNYNL
uniref:Uncharacterized protein n=1 Tax=Rhizophora mucronata TaxID=61149 RepID=A0A2P2P5Q4_RHIMU